MDNDANIMPLAPVEAVMTGKQHDRMLRESRATGERSLKMALVEATIIKENIYVQREKRTLFGEEIPVCSCKPPEGEGQFGCLEDCVNRAALIECLPGHCPCGDKCDNQRIQRGIMPQSEIIECGKKGLGVRALQDIQAGDFVAEYMGEIVTEQEYHLRRLRYHNEKHRYMMVLSGGEVIDATRMGGVARFINHSCNPNCGVEKWDVDGEERCGIFARQDIHYGQELTFDYKFESFSRLEITKCLCGAHNCRGYIGVKTSTGESLTTANNAKRKPFDPIIASLGKRTSSRKAAELVLDRIVRVLMGQRVVTKKESNFVGLSRVMLRRNLRSHRNFRSLCLEQYFVSANGRLEDLEPVFRLQDLEGYPAKPPELTSGERQANLETTLERLRTPARYGNN